MCFIWAGDRSCLRQNNIDEAREGERERERERERGREGGREGGEQDSYGIKQNEFGYSLCVLYVRVTGCA